MKESIKVKNLGPLKYVYIEEIKPVTVLIGESGSGKSTLMKAIALFRWLYKMYNIRVYLKQSNISKSPFQFNMETYLKNCGFEQFVSPETEILYIVSGLNLKYEVMYKDKTLIFPLYDELIASEDICFNKISFISETRNNIPYWSEKGASLTGANLGFYFHEVFNDFDLASEKIGEFDLNFLNVQFAVKRTKSDKKKYEIRSVDNDTFRIDYQDSSSGIINSVPVALICTYFAKYFNFEEAFNRSVLYYLSNTGQLTDFKAIKNSLELQKKVYIHIEEPELGLDPDAQCSLLNHLLYHCFCNAQNSVELFISTHSPYITNHLNLLIKAHEKNKAIEGANLNYDDIAVYHLCEGIIEDLKIQNKKLINTDPLSDTINDIYDRYSELDKE
jgi:predicted ATPase